MIESSSSFNRSKQGRIIPNNQPITIDSSSCNTTGKKLCDLNLKIKIVPNYNFSNICFSLFFRYIRGNSFVTEKKNSTVREKQNDFSSIINMISTGNDPKSNEFITNTRSEQQNGMNLTEFSFPDIFNSVNNRGFVNLNSGNFDVDHYSAFIPTTGHYNNPPLTQYLLPASTPYPRVNDIFFNNEPVQVCMTAQEYAAYNLFIEMMNKLR